jgi:cutinase
MGVAVVTVVAAVSACAAPAPPLNLPSASANSCPDIEVVFARATGEPPGIGAIGQAFIDDLRSQVKGKSLGGYAVNYPASSDFSKAVDGANDASAHVQWVAANCPGTRLVLGGFSQGAAVIDLITGAPIPVTGFTDPMPPEVADHVAAVVVFGNPSNTMAGGPLTALSPLYGHKAIDLCVTFDPICTKGGLIIAHGLYIQLGMVHEGAKFAASRL